MHMRGAEAWLLGWHRMRVQKVAHCGSCRLCGCSGKAAAAMSRGALPHTVRCRAVAMSGYCCTASKWPIGSGCQMALLRRAPACPCVPNTTTSACGVGVVPLMRWPVLPACSPGAVHGSLDPAQCCGLTTGESWGPLLFQGVSGAVAPGRLLLPPAVHHASTTVWCRGFCWYPPSACIWHRCGRPPRLPGLPLCSQVLVTHRSGVVPMCGAVLAAPGR